MANQCDTCAFMGGISWDNGCRQEHYCDKSDERRRDTMKPTGDRAQDFMDNFRAFFDAGSGKAACKYYEEGGAPNDADLSIMRKISIDGFAVFAFFSDENSFASKHPSKYYERDSHHDVRHGEGRAYRLTQLGLATLARIQKMEAA